MSNDKQQQLETMYASCRDNFPNVPDISAKDLMARLESGDELVLVDVRQPQEQEVSMIPGAITADQFQQSAAEYKGKTIVPYCTIGGRSGMYSLQLQQQGWDVLNFAGSVIAWSQAGGQFESNGKPSNKVFVHSEKYDIVHQDHEVVIPEEE